jgi:hypothetical protein
MHRLPGDGRPCGCLIPSLRLPATPAPPPVWLRLTDPAGGSASVGAPRVAHSPTPPPPPLAAGGPSDGPDRPAPRASQQPTPPVTAHTCHWCWPRRPPRGARPFAARLLGVGRPCRRPARGAPHPQSAGAGPLPAPLLCPCPPPSSARGLRSLSLRLALMGPRLGSSRGPALMGPRRAPPRLYTCTAYTYARRGASPPRPPGRYC